MKKPFRVVTENWDQDSHIVKRQGVDTLDQAYLLKEKLLKRSNSKVYIETKSGMKIN
jgi:hypothetical protein